MAGAGLGRILSLRATVAARRKEDTYNLRTRATRILQGSGNADEARPRIPQSASVPGDCSGSCGACRPRLREGRGRVREATASLAWWLDLTGWYRQLPRGSPGCEESPCPFPRENLRCLRGALLCGRPAGRGVSLPRPPAGGALAGELFSCVARGCARADPTTRFTKYLPQLQAYADAVGRITKGKSILAFGINWIARGEVMWLE